MPRPVQPIELFVLCPGLSAVVLARDKFMKEDGSMYPSQARMFLAPIRTQASNQRINDFQV